MLLSADGGRLVLADGGVLPLAAGESATLQIVDGVATWETAPLGMPVDEEVAALQAAIAAGADPSAIQEAPAAGAGAEGGGGLADGGGFSSPFDLARVGRVEASSYRYDAAFEGAVPEITVTPASFSPQGGAAPVSASPVLPDDEDSVAPEDSVQPTITIRLDAIAVDDIVNRAESSQPLVLAGQGGGDAIAGDRVTVTIGGVAYETVLGQDLRFSITVPGGLLADNLSATATLTHGVGDTTVTATSVRPYAVDLEPPVLSVSLDAIASDDLLNASEAGQSLILSGRVGGDARVGDTVTLLVGSESYSATVNADLTFRVAVAGSTLAANSGAAVTAVISQADAAGNVGTATSSRAYTVDTAAPQLSIALDAVSGDDVINAAEANQTIPVTGRVTGEYAAGDSVTVTVGNQSYTGVLNAGGAFSINVPGSQLSQNSAISAVVSHTDAAGNNGSANIAANYAVDTQAPQVSITLDSVTSDNLVNAVEARGSVSVTGRVGGDVVQGDTVTISVGGQSYTVAVGANGTFAANIPGSVLTNAGAGSIRAAVSHADAAGNIGQAETTHGYRIDVAPPVAAADVGSIDENGVLSMTANQGVLANDRDADTAREALVVSAVNGAAGGIGQPVVGSNGGTFTLSSDGAYRFDPGTAFDRLAVGQTETTQVRYTVSDGQGGNATSTLTITVTGTNDVPVAVADTRTTGENAVLTGQVPAATDVDGTIASYSLDSNVGTGNGGLSFNSDGSYTFTPGTDFDALAAGESRDVTFSYTATDNDGGVSEPQTVTITVTGTNDAPVAVADTQTTDENTVLTGQVPAATDVDGTIASYSLDTDVGPGNGSLSFNSDGSYTFTLGTDFDALAAGESRDVTFTYTATDNDGGVSAPQTVTITVTGTNDVPVAVADTQTTGENTVLNGQVPAATDIDGTIASYSLDTDVGTGNGSLAFNSDGSYTFTPGKDFDALAAGESRDVTFTYTATDNDGGVSAPQTVTITVTGTNDAPVAQAATATTEENTVLTGQVPAATDVDGTIASYALDTDVGAGNGSLSFNSDGSYTFTPGADFDALAAGQSRDVTFTYTTTDNDGGVSAPQTVTITVTGTNDAPVAVADTQTTGENSVLTGQVPAATDVDGTIASYALDTDVGSGNGSLSFNADGSYSFTPGTDFDALAAGESRDVTFSYTGTDNDGGVSEPQTVTITVTGTNDAPVAVADTQTTVENTVLTGQVPAATNVDGTIAGYELAMDVGTGNGSLAFNSDGSYTFTPGTDFDALAAGESRDVTFTYTATDNDGGVSAPQTITITVTGTNDAPVAVADTQTTDENTVLTGQVPAATDVDGTITSYALDTDVGTGNGNLSFNADGSYTFDPGTDFDALAVGQSRDVTFSYTATDNDGGVSAPQTVTITVTGTNDVPVAVADTQTTGENTVLAGQVPAATDVDGTIASYALDTDVGTGNGSLTFNADGSYRFDPGTDFDALAAGESRDVTFSYTATDNDGGVSAPQTVTITVTGTNDAPVAQAAVATTEENTILTGQVPAATDVDGTIASYSLDTDVGQGNGSLSFNADGSYRFDPGSDFDALAAGQSRDVTFSYTATDNAGDVSTPQTVTITVTGTNDAPVAVADTQTTGENTVLTGQVPAATDVDGTIASYALDTDVGTGNGSLTFNADGSYSFDPGTDFDALAAGESRDVTFSYTATDNAGASSAPVMVTITVTGTNDAPVAVADTQTTGENTVLTGQVPAATDVDGTIASYSLKTDVGAGNGSLVFNVDGSYRFNPGTDFDSLAAGQSRDVTFTYTATDDSGAVSAPQTVTITVTGTNDVPVAQASTVTTEENAVLTGQVPAATDVDGTIASYELATDVGAGNGSLAFNSDGSYTFTPGTDFEALATGESRDVIFSYTATDNAGGVSEPQTVTITVTGTNDAPVAVADTQTTGENAVLTGQVSAATDVDGTIVSYSLYTDVGTGNGSLNFNADGSYTFTPGADFDALAAGQSRDITFSYTATDNDGGVSAPQTVTITVTGTNDVPVAVADTQTTGENTVLAGQVPAATDVDGTIASYSLETDVGQGNGSLNFNADGSYTFTPGADFDALAVGQSREVTFTFTATDNTGASSAPATVTITVTGTNDVPVAVADTQTTGENSVLTGQVPAATDVDGTIASYALDTDVGQGNGSLAFNADGYYTFTPGTDFDALPAGQSRNVTFTYTTTDNNGGVSAPQTVTITVTGTNDAPVAVADTLTTGENTALTGQVPAAIDVDGSIVSYSLETDVGQGNGSLAFNADGSYTFTPGMDFDALATGESRDVTFTYTATDNDGGVSAPQTVTITVTGTNDVPVAVADTQTTSENTVLTGQVPAATDVDGTIASYSLETDVGQGNGSLAFNADGSYTFDPGADFDVLAAGESRDVTFSYTATDNAGASSAPVMVTITVTGTNDAPVAVA
ncbi:tandem-95 repeat protein, partial [Salinicola avicenniae]|uniref:tandem-95 repeat protein n=1 Tax=Salinicola avicenniae TaxID=2916836 RepID=UPI0020738F42